LTPGHLKRETNCGDALIVAKIATLRAKGQMDILITGGGGFVSPYLLDALDPSWAVTLHVRDPRKAAEMQTRPRIRIISGPLTNATLLNEVPEGCRLVIHLAGAFRGENIEAILESNLVSTGNVLSFMKERRVPHLVFMSTAAVWSDSTGARLTERIPSHPTTPYGYAKLAAECLIRDAIRQGNLASAAILRANTTYGRGSGQGVVSAFRSCAMRGQPFAIDGDGQQLREPLCISDLVDAIVRTIDLGTGLHVYGISGPETLSILQIAKMMAIVLGIEFRVDWKPARTEHSRHLLVGTEKARKELGWVPRVRFEEGIRLLFDVDQGGQ